MGGVGKTDELGVELLLHGGTFVTQGFLVGFEGCRALFQHFGFVAFAALEEEANLFGQVVLFGFHGVAFLLQTATTLVERQNLIDAFFDVGDILNAQSFNDFFTMFFDIL